MGIEYDIFGDYLRSPENPIAEKFSLAERRLTRSNLSVLFKPLNRADDPTNLYHEL